MDTLNGQIPNMLIRGTCLPEAWEKAVLAVWDNGIDVKTDYDKPGDPASRDATVMIVVEDPFNEPRIHKNFPGGPEELEAYRQEVVDGIHDHWIKPEEDKWTYTYHQRLFAYQPAVIERMGAEDKVLGKGIKGVRPLRMPFLNMTEIPSINQINYIVDDLCRQLYTRRAQAVTWMPSMDPVTYDPPCLQRVWCRILKDEKGGLVLNMNTHWRSRDGVKAWFMNAFALTDLQKSIASRVSEKIGQNVRLGRYVDISDSWHIYGSYFRGIGPELEKMRDGNWQSRAWRSDDEAFAFMTEEAKEKLAKDPDHYAKGKG